jgi:CRISPR system Cascade subunit CasD
MKSLTIRLTAPLQSYGNEATFNRRTTDDYPSKSAIIGMIAAALGYRRDDSRINSLNKLLMAVRIDQPGKVLTDFHMVEYAQNSKKTKRKLTYRDYLQDAVFIVAIGSKDEDLIDRIEYALKHPYFQLSLGRRSNAPAGLLR